MVYIVSKRSFEGDRMLESEKNIIKYVGIKDRRNAVRSYKEVIENLQDYDLGSYSNIRCLKNYLISLNTLLYQHHSQKSCKNEIFKKRNSLLKEIELASNIEETYRIGIEMLDFYIELNSEHIKKTDSRIINDIIFYINMNSSKNLDLRKLSEKYELSVNYLSTIFKEYVGESFSKYVNRVRIIKAKELLEHTGNSILEIAMDCGFNSQSYFNYVFKNLEDMSPREYRKIRKR